MHTHTARTVHGDTLYLVALRRDVYALTRASDANGGTIDYGAGHEIRLPPGAVVPSTIDVTCEDVP